jgi:Tfp pilus assembly protein PilX
MEGAVNVFRSERGSALVLSLLALLVLTVLGLSLVGLGMTEFAISTNWKDYTRTFYAAEAATESGIVTLRNQLNLNPTPTQAQLCAMNGTTNGACAPATTAANLPTLNSAPAGMYTFNTYTFNWGVNAYCVSANNPQGCTNGAPHNYRTTMPTGPYSGMFGITTDYVITAGVTGPGGTRSTISQTYQYIQVPLFQFGVFYGRGVDLEIAPGPLMTFNGRVHANSDIYVGAGNTSGAGGAGITFDSFITTSGTMFRYMKRNPADYPFSGKPDNVHIKDASGVMKKLNFDHDKAAGFGSNHTEAQWTSLLSSTYGGTVKDKTLGVQDIIPPVPSMFYNPAQPDVEAHKLIELPDAADPPNLASAKMYAQAGLRIDVTGAVATATDSAGNAVALPAGTVTTKSFFDKRENAVVTVAEIDMSKLSTRGSTATACGAGSAFDVAASLAGSLGSKGVLYVADSSKTKSVRLVNGDCLPNIQAGGGSGLTVVSQNPVYIQGDFNCPGCAGSQPATPPVGQVSAAVLADAVTVLSRNWAPNNSDTKGNQVVGNRPATATTVNAALMFGPSNESTPANGGNGQLENLPRFLESWSNVNFNYSGSLVALWHSQQSVSQWIAPGTYYQAPKRNWKYDTRFDTVQPPGTPSGVIQAKGRWSQG